MMGKIAALAVVVWAMVGLKQSIDNPIYVDPPAMQSGVNSSMAPPELQPPWVIEDYPPVVIDGVIHSRPRFEFVEVFVGPMDGDWNIKVERNQAITHGYWLSDLPRPILGRVVLPVEMDALVRDETSVEIYGYHEPDNPQRPTQLMPWVRRVLVPETKVSNLPRVKMQAVRRRAVRS